nr:PEGA domain-containing protein [uncultured Methanospirillum sp.]
MTKLSIIGILFLILTMTQPIYGLVLEKAPETTSDQVGTIQINGPSGVAILIDNVPKGLIPESGTLMIPDVRGGSRQLLMLRDEHPNESWNVEVFVNKTEVVNISSESLYGTLEVTANPANVIAYLDTSYFGVTPISSDKVLVGGHKIRIHQEGFQDWSQDLMITSGVKTSVNADLVKLEPTTTPTKAGIPGFTAILALLALMMIGILVKRKKY